METDDKGKASVKKLGLAPVQREGMEYEFTVFFDISQDHYAKATKDRTNMFGNEVFIMDEQTGLRFAKWLNEGRADTDRHEARDHGPVRAAWKSPCRRTKLRSGVHHRRDQEAYRHQSSPTRT